MALENFGKKVLLDSYKIFKKTCVGDYTGLVKNKSTPYKNINWFNTPEPPTDVNDIKSNQISFLDVPANITLNAIELNAENIFVRNDNTPLLHYNSFLEMYLNHNGSGTASPFPIVSKDYKFILTRIGGGDVDFDVQIPNQPTIANVYNAVVNYTDWGIEPNGIVVIRATSDTDTLYYIAIAKYSIVNNLGLPTGQSFGANLSGTSDYKTVIPFSDSGVEPIVYINEGTLLVEKVEIKID